MSGLTHVNENGDVRMVDVSEKDDTVRVAVAEGFIAMQPETLELITTGQAAKGDVLACARVAGVMAAKNTSSININSYFTFIICILILYSTKYTIRFNFYFNIAWHN